MLKFIPQTLPTNVFVIGCGGTGSRVVPLIAQSMAGQEWLLGARLTLVDDDVVEVKNTSRQNFIAPDVGRHKADVLAERYGNAFGLEINAIKDRITRGSTLLRQAARFHGDKGVGNPAPIVILCVDSAAARRDILESLVVEGIATRDTIIIDAGNEDIFGQVSIFNLSSLGASEEYSFTRAKTFADAIPERLPFEQEITTIPIPWAQYLLMEDGEGTGSCADLDQTLAINNLVAANIVAMFQNLLYSLPIYSHKVYVSLNGGGNNEWLSTQWLRGLCSRERDDVYMLKGDVNATPASAYFRRLYTSSLDHHHASMDDLLDVARAVEARYKLEMQEAAA